MKCRPISEIYDALCFESSNLAKSVILDAFFSQHNFYCLFFNPEARQEASLHLHNIWLSDVCQIEGSIKIKRGSFMCYCLK